MLDRGGRDLPAVLLSQQAAAGSCSVGTRASSQADFRVVEWTSLGSLGAVVRGQQRDFPRSSIPQARRRLHRVLALLAEQKDRFSSSYPIEQTPTSRCICSSTPTTDARAMPAALPSPARAVVLARASVALSELVHLDTDVSALVARQCPARPRGIMWAHSTWLSVAVRLLLIAEIPVVSAAWLVGEVPVLGIHEAQRVRGVASEVLGDQCPGVVYVGADLRGSEEHG